MVKKFFNSALENIPKDIIKSTGAYIIHDTTKDKFYIGSAKNILQRKNSHEGTLNNNKHHNKQLQEAFNNGNELNFIALPLNDRNITR